MWQLINRLVVGVSRGILHRDSFWPGSWRTDLTGVVTLPQEVNSRFWRAQISRSCFRTLMAVLRLRRFRKWCSQNCWRWKSDWKDIKSLANRADYTNSILREPRYKIDLRQKHEPHLSQRNPVVTKSERPSEESFRRSETFKSLRQRACLPVQPSA